MGGGQGVAEFMQTLGQGQGEQKADHGGGGETGVEAGDKDIPLAQCQEQPEEAERRQQGERPRPRQPPDQGQQSLQEAFRSDQRQAKEQVVVQQPFQPAGVQRPPAGEQVVGVLGMMDGEQLVREEKSVDQAQFLRTWVEQGFAVYRSEDGGRSRQVPADE